MRHQSQVHDVGHPLSSHFVCGGATDDKHEFVSEAQTLSLQLSAATLRGAATADVTRSKNAATGKIIDLNIVGAPEVTRLSMTGATERYSLSPWCLR